MEVTISRKNGVETNVVTDDICHIEVDGTIVWYPEMDEDFPDGACMYDQYGDYYQVDYLYERPFSESLKRKMRNKQFSGMFNRFFKAIKQRFKCLNFCVPIK